MNNVITLTLLQESGACNEQCDKFAELFGESVVVTREKAIEHANVFDWHWAADEFLTSKAYDNVFHVAQVAASEEHDAATTPFVKAYNAARDAAWAEYDKAVNSLVYAARSEHHAVRATAIKAAFAEYETAIAPLQAAYRRALAAAFVDAFLSPENQDDVDPGANAE